MKYEHIREYIEYIDGLSGGIVEDRATEYTPRAKLQKLLEAAAKGISPRLYVLHEPKGTHLEGRPDFIITQEASGALVGCVETKKMGDDLKKYVDSPKGKEQLSKYSKSSPNILLTNYKTFCIWHDGATAWSAKYTSEAELDKLLTRFLSVAPQKIKTAKRLAKMLSTHCVVLRDALEDVLPKTKTPLNDLRDAFASKIYHDQFEDADFADALSQTSAYGLLMAKLNEPQSKLDLSTFYKVIPENFGLMREIAKQLREVEDLAEKKGAGNASIKYSVDAVLATINTIDTDAISKSMSYGSNSSQGNDPYIYFYENFLKDYDPDQRASRGIYYTPPDVVRFMVKAADEVLHSKLDLEGGLSNTNVTVLDFATGTGTFLLETFRHVLEGQDPAGADLLARKHLLKNFCGFELLIAPYAVAHMKLLRFLQDRGVNLPSTSGQPRIPVYLTDALEPGGEDDGKQTSAFIKHMSDEVNLAQKVKDSKILLVIGNPPYAGDSQNQGDWITRKMDTYKQIGNKSLGERNIKGVMNDYVKFLRFAQHKMEQVSEGAIVVITDHSFLDATTFRGVRHSLLSSFKQLYFWNLHGNSRKSERIPAGVKDQNVFDIQQGVVVSVLVKSPKLEKKVCYADLWGTRKHKYQQCSAQEFGKINWIELNPMPDQYRFLPSTSAKQIGTEYNRFYPLKDIFGTNGVGVFTGRDHFTLGYSESEFRETLEQFKNMSPEEARAQFNLKADTETWQVAAAQEDLKVNDGTFCEMLYRPFDTRMTYYTGRSNGFHSRPRRIMKHLFNRDDDQVALMACRSTTSATKFSHVFVTDGLASSHVAIDMTYVFPLFTYQDDTEQRRMEPEEQRKLNIQDNFLKWLNMRYGQEHTSRDIFGCIYAILHSEVYRERYAEQLRYEFPRIPFPEENDGFESLAKFGNELIKAHLLRQPPQNSVSLKGDTAEHKVEEIKHVASEGGKLFFNSAECLAPIPAEVDKFEIGGKNPLRQYLEFRKGRTLSSDELATLMRAAEVIEFTITKRQEIDEVVGPMLSKLEGSQPQT